MNAAATSSMESETLQAALWLAEQGIPVFPCHCPEGLNGCSCHNPLCTSQGKHPRTEHGFQNASTDPEQLKKWWDQWPDANLAIATGLLSGLFVMDFDPRNGAPSDREGCAQLIGGIPDAAAEVISGGGGRHIYFKYEPTLFPWGTPKDIADGVEVKAEGKYAMAPPSLHPSEKRYVWDGMEGRNHLLTLPLPPAALIEKINAAVLRKNTPPAEERKWGKGERNNQLARLAGAMRRYGMTATAIAPALQEANRNQCEPPLGADEVRQISENISRYPPSQIAPDYRIREESSHSNGAAVPAIREAEPLAVVNARNGSGAAVVLQEPDLDSTAEPPLDALVEQGDAIEPVKPDPLPEQPQPSKKKSKKTAQSANDEPKKDSQATKLIRMINEVAFSHTPEGALFASFSINNHHETHSIRSKAFRIYMQRRYHDETGSALGKNGLSDALGVFEGRAVYDGPEKEVFCRIAQHGDAIYIDLGDPEWRAIEVTREGWCVVSEYPVNFRRAKGMLELPVPIENDPDAERHFRECINVQTDDDFALVKAWVLGALRPTGPYPVIWLKGPQGSAKTTTSKVLRQLLDPNQAAMRPLPKEERDFMIAASNSRLLALDNMSHLPDWASDSLCRITTGAGFATREMYSDTEETLFNVICPVIINGIDEVMTRGDLIDRTLVVELAEIPKDSRLTEKEFWSLFEQYRPGILGYFLNALQAAMSNLDSVKLDRLPRMADFALFVTAAEESFGWKPGYFLEIYDRNRAEANSIVLDSSPVAQKLRTFVDKLTDGTYQRLYLLEGKWEPEAGNSDVSTWTGPAAALLRNLNKLTNDEERKPKSWPKEARSLSVALRRLVANLKADGLIVHFCRESKARDIQISRTSSVSHTTEIGDANDDAK